MVKIIIVSEYSTNPPAELGGGRVKITAGPLYGLARVQALIEDENNLMIVTDKGRKDFRKWFDDDLQQIADLIGLLMESDYIDSEWCETGKGAAIAACDAYRLRVNESDPVTGRRDQMQYFLKFAVSKTGAVVLMLSCHA